MNLSGCPSFRRVAAPATIALAVLFSLTQARSDPSTTLYSFSAVVGDSLANSDGDSPEGGLVQTSDGSIFGTSVYGGSNGTGTVYKIKLGSPNPTVTVIHTFGSVDSGGENADGSGPYPGLTLGADGNLYGITNVSGGANGFGTIFEIQNPESDSPTFTTLYSFASADPRVAYGPLVEDSNGVFYGTGSVGGADGVGGVFELKPNSGPSTGYTFSEIYSFTGAADGANPHGTVSLGNNGVLYGTTSAVIGSGKAGTLYSLTPDSGASTGFDFSSLYTFTGGADGSQPSGTLVVGSGGGLSGVAYKGGTSGFGTVFRWAATPGTSPLTVLHSFGTQFGYYEGRFPLGGLIQGSDGSLYGLASQGGRFDCGTVFKISTAGRLIVLHDLSGGQLANPDGANANGQLLLSSGVLYAATSAGGANDTGSIISVGDTNPAPRILWENSGTGDVYLWNMTFNSGSYQLANYQHVTTLADTTWRIAGWRDIDGDAVPDLIWQNSKSGEIYYWLMQQDPVAGYEPQTGNFYTYVDTVPDTTWKVVTTADINGQGVPDLLWQNTSSGSTCDWLMDADFGWQFTRFDLIAPQISGVFALETAGYFSGDNIEDVIWRNTATGDIWWWQMADDNTNFYHMLGYHYVGTVSDLDFSIVGAADITGNGIPDLLWRNNLTGDYYYWIMTYDENGYHLLSSTSYYKLTNLPTSWRVAGFGE